LAEIGLVVRIVPSFAPLTVVAAALPSLCALSVTVRQGAAAQFKVGVAAPTFSVDKPYNWRGAKTPGFVTTIWYPADAAVVEQPQFIGTPGVPLFLAGNAAPGAALVGSRARFPLIVLSHGTGGSALQLAWLGTVLASHGYITAAVNHPGNNPMTVTRHKDSRPGGNEPVT
jgi:predicted dienelactone hydrolase